MANTLPNRSNPQSLTAQIRAAEQQVLHRQRAVGVCAAALARKLHQQMTAPATLLLAGGIGFIVGELTRHPSSASPGTADKRRPAETTPWRTALNLLASAHTLYTALPLAWLMKSSRPPGASRPAPQRRDRPVAASGLATAGQGES
jgi:hypothetical protein